MVFAYSVGAPQSPEQAQLVLTSLPDDDWFSVTLPAGKSTLRVETSTPGDGPNNFVNLLDPKVEVYDSTGTTLLGTGTALLDGRNESVTLENLTAGATYKIRLIGEGAGTGEYFLGASFPTPTSPPPPPPPPPGPPPPPAGVVLVNGTTTPSDSYTASRVTSLTVSFPGSVASVSPGAFGLTNGTTTLSVGAGITVTGLGSSTLTLTFVGTAGVEFGSLSDGVWTLTTDNTKINFTAGGTGTGTTTTDHIRRLFGDGDGNGTVNLIDYKLFSAARRRYDAQFDYNADSVINVIDSQEFNKRFGLWL